MRLFRLLPLVAAAAVAAVAAGCGGSGKAAGTTTTTAATRTTGAGGPFRALSAIDRAKLEKYSTCLQQHGVDFGGFSGNGQPPAGGLPQGAPPPGGTTTFTRPDLTAAQQKARQKAFNACRSLAPSGFRLGRPGGQRGQQGGQFAAYRKCMQLHGVNLSAPGSGQQQPSSSSKKFRAATQACGHLLVQPQTGTTDTTSTGAG